MRENRFYIASGSCRVALGVVAASFIAILARPVSAGGQGIFPATATAPASAPLAGLISLSFPDNVEIKVLVDYVSQRLGFNVTYEDEQVASQHVTIKTPVRIRSDELLSLLQNVLKTRGLVLVDSEQVGWKKIVALDRGATIEFVSVHNADVEQVAKQLKQILAAKARGAGAGAAGDKVSAEGIEVAADKRSGQIAIVGPSDVVRAGLAVVRALDVAVNSQQSPVRFYKLANTTAADVLDTIRALEGDDASGGGAASTNRAAGNRPGGSNSNGLAAPGSPALSSGPNANGPAGAAPSSGASYANDATSGVTPGAPRGPGAIFPGGGTSSSAAPAALHTAAATVAADVNTNTLIVVGDPSVQHVYEQLIRTLDKRRPQVLIEATIVTLDTTNNYQFGVELSANSHPGKDQAVTFSNFGLSTPNPTTGSLALIPGMGFNGAVVASDVANVIIRAFQENIRAKITSAPRILVNDNATGMLSSLSEQPYSSTNIGTSVSTTSFGGYAEAGTEVILTPHISESDYLQLEYQVSLSSFATTSDSAQLNNGIPPPRQKDSVQSKVTIPDGSTIIVGGLNRKNYNRTVSSVPVLGDIPVLKYLFSNRNRTEEQITLFVFLRPIILRDDEFEDLKFLSQRDVKLAGIPGTMPSSEPLPVH